jgi:uncharacterized protein (TIGR03067 family)
VFVRVICLLAATPLLAADPPPPKGPADLQGAWRLVSVDAEAGPVNLPEPRPALVIRGDKVLYGGEEIARLTADAAATPKIVDLRFAADKVYEGVYTIEKEALKVALNGRSEGVKERPDGFAVTGHPARRVLAFERVKPEDAGPGNGFVGISLRQVAEPKEIVVDFAVTGSPAAKAGLKKGDVVLEIGGAGVTDLQGAVDAVRKAKPGSELVVKVRRDGKDREIKVKVGLLPFAVLAGLE